MTLELHDRIVEHHPDQTIAWLRDSALVDDSTTTRVVGALELAHNAFDHTLRPDVTFALVASPLHRATNIATGPDGESIDDYTEIPGDLDTMTLEILRGHTSRAAMEEHCTSFETTVATCMLNMATRWADDHPAYKWTRTTIRNAHDPTHLSREIISALEDIETTVIDE
jgi:hypothetical protein